MANLTDVTLKGFIDDSKLLTWNLKTGITSADEGKCVTQDTTAANTVKLAGNGDAVYGIIVKVEDRTAAGAGGSLVGTIYSGGGVAFPYTNGAAVAIGDNVVGSATVAGEVKTAAAAGKYIVTEVDTSTLTAVVVLA